MKSLPPNLQRNYLLIVAFCLIGIVLAGVVGRAFMASSQPIAPVPAPTEAAATVLDATAREKVVLFCGACHRLPSAEHFPKAAWHHEVQRGFQFYNESGRTDLEPPPLQTVVAYYQSTAPERLVIPPIASSSKPPPVRFQQAGFSADTDQSTPQRSTISAVNWLQRRPGRGGELFCSDMRHGDILKVSLGRDALRAETYLKVPHPVVVRVCDLDADGQTELVVADLGSFLPEDHELGGVWWFRTAEKQSQGSPILSAVGRIADVQPVDADGDGDQDLLVAEFGWHKTGGIHLLENQGVQDGQLKLARHKLDPRSGTIHLPTADLNGDDRPDFVALISQEHESVVAFSNIVDQGKLKFQPTVLDEPQDPSSGSSGMSLVDLDLDGDLDALVTNGDSFDSFYLKPAHSVCWLENQGGLKFARHHITPMPGAHRALAGDLDGDGDLDIVVAAFLPQELRSQQPDTEFDSLILLEQTQPGQFERHRLEAGQCHHAALEMADFDEDGDLDLAVANFAEQQTDNLPPLTVWWNLRIDH